MKSNVEVHIGFKQQFVQQFVSTRFAAFLLILGSVLALRFTRLIDEGAAERLIELDAVGFTGLKLSEWLKKPKNGCNGNGAPKP